ncbi:MAG: TlpA disulfide reductase family protein [Casimicrobiaceae bacterium]
MRIALLVLAVGAAGAGVGRLTGEFFFKTTPAPSAAATLYAVTLPDLAGVPQSLQQWRGKVLVVNFWATWCVPCREEMPALVALQSRYGAKGLQIVGIGIDDAGKMRQFTRSIDLNYPALDGGYGALELSRVVGNAAMALPYTVVLDRGGKVIAQQLGPFTARQLDELATQLL